MRRHILAFTCFLLSPLGCSSGDELASAAQYATDVAPGFHEIDPDGAFVDVALSDTHAYLIESWGGTELVVVELATMTVVDRIAPVDDRPALPAAEQDRDEYRSDLKLEGVQVLDDGQVVVFGTRDDAQPLDLWAYFGGSMRIQRSFVVQGLGADGHGVEWSVGLDLRGALQSSDGRWPTERESMNAFVGDDSIAITLSHGTRPDRVLTIPRPSGHEMYQLVASSSSSLPAAPTTPLGHVDTPRAIAAADDGAYLVTASDGLFRVTEDQALNLAPALSFDADHYLTDLRVVGGLVLVADHGRGLQVLSSSDGRLIDSVPLDFYERGVAASDNQVVVGAETGLSVTNIRWTPSDPGPAPQPGGDEPIDGAGGTGGGDGSGDDAEPAPSDLPNGDCHWSWEWIPFGFGGYYGWVERCD